MKVQKNQSMKELKIFHKELQLKKMKTSILDFYQSKLFWEKINNLELFSGTKNNLLRAVIPPATSLDLMKYLKK